MGVDDRLPPCKQPGRQAVELHASVLGEAFAEGLPVARPHSLVVPRDVLVEEIHRPGQAEVLAHETEQHPVCPLPVPSVRPALDALAEEPDPPRVSYRTLVEAVDLELEAVEAEVEQQVARQHPGGILGPPPAAAGRAESAAPALGERASPH